MHEEVEASTTYVPSSYIVYDGISHIMRCIRITVFARKPAG